MINKAGEWQRAIWISLQNRTRWFLEACKVRNSVSHVCRMEEAPCWEIGTEKDLMLWWIITYTWSSCSTPWPKCYNDHWTVIRRIRIKAGSLHYSGEDLPWGKREGATTGCSSSARSGLGLCASDRGESGAPHSSPHEPVLRSSSLAPPCFITACGTLC